MEKTALVKELGTMLLLRKAKKSQDLATKKFYYDSAMRYKKGYESGVNKITDIATKDVPGTKRIRFIPKRHQKTVTRALLNNPQLAPMTVAPVPGIFTGTILASNKLRSKLNKSIDADLRAVTKKVDKFKFAKLKTVDALRSIYSKIKMSG